ATDAITGYIGQCSCKLPPGRLMWELCSILGATQKLRKVRGCMLPFRIVDRVKFIVERQLVKGAGFQLLVVGFFIGLISLIGGLLVVPQGGEFDDPGAAVWWAFLRLTDSGYLGDDVGTWQRVV